VKAAIETLYDKFREHCRLQKFQRRRAATSGGNVKAAIESMILKTDPGKYIGISPGFRETNNAKRKGDLCNFAETQRESPAF
jgi:hypothetical protein